MALQVTDAVFTNSIAKVSLLGAHDLATLAGHQPNATFKAVAEGLRILYDKQRDFHPAYICGDTGLLYNTTCGAPAPLSCISRPDGGLIKQADVVLIYCERSCLCAVPPPPPDREAALPLADPINVSMPRHTQKNDLDIYSRLTDIDGPAMTWMIHSIAYGDIGDDALAEFFFRKSYEGLVRGPFFVCERRRRTLSKSTVHCPLRKRDRELLACAQGMRALTNSAARPTSSTAPGCTS